MSADGYVYSFDVSGFDDRTKEQIVKQTIDQVNSLARLGIVDMFGHRTDNSNYVIRVPHEITGGTYEADLGQLIAFVMGAKAAVETAAKYMDSDVSQVDIHAEVMKIVREMMEKDDTGRS